MSIENRRGFSFIEVMACVLILGMALTIACGLILYGLHLARSAHGRTLGMATALSVLADSSPLATDPAMSPSAPTTSGYLNGFWVTRTESDETPLAGASGKLVAVTVCVDVFETEYGECFASTSRRMIRVKLP